MKNNTIKKLFIIAISGLFMFCSADVSRDNALDPLSEKYVEPEPPAPTGPFVIFVTATIDTAGTYMYGETYNGNLGGISGADTKCNNSMLNPDTSKQYKALLVDGAARAASPQVDWVLLPNIEYQRPDGTVIGTTNTNAVFNFPLTNRFAPNDGTGMYYPSYWTGLNSDWSTSPNDCNDWNAPAAQFGTIGIGASLNTDSISEYMGPYDCYMMNLPLLCVEQ
ncbi:MAG: DUF1554 domain-containing protein [Spirochaetia bacterium]|nr:DUF1554 domain-containing protein [Spirochaetia bacterium]